VADVASRPAYSYLGFILVIHITLGSFVQIANPAFGIVFEELFVFAGLTLLLVLALNFRPVGFLALHPPKARLWPAAIVAGIGGFFASGAINALNRLLVGPEIAAQYDVTRLFEVRSTFEGALLVFGVAVCAPIGEEFLFRGYLLRVLKARHGVVPALLITSVLFAAFHFNPASILALFALGLVFGLLRLWSGSIWPAVLAHAIQNGVASALVLSGLAAESPDELPAAEAFLLLAISAPVVIAALAWLRRLGPDGEDEVQTLDPAADHRLAPNRILRQGAIGLGAALLAIALLFAVDGEAARSRLQRVIGPRAQEATPAAAPDPGETTL